MAWAYCRKCDQQLGEPTAREVLEEDAHCGNCGQEITFKKKVDAILEILTRLEAVEAHLGIVV